MYCPQLIDNPMHPQFHPSLGWNMGEEAFNNASLRVLFVFPSGMGVRVVSATHQALYNIVKDKYGDDVFVDICMLPVDSYRNKYFKHFPAIAGYFSKHTIEDFEVIGCSIAITMTEIVELPIFLNRAGFNVDHKSRMADDKAPLLVVGGVAADGQSYLDSVVDLVMLGAGERTIPFLLDKVFEGQSRYGTVGKAKEWIIGACTGVKGFYNPHVYKYKHDVVDGKWQSEYLGCDIPDLPTPHHDNDLPAEVIRVNDRQLRLPLPGAEQHKLSLQSSFGCGGAASQCTFCKEGWDYGCYASHTPVFTKRGMLQIKDVQVGDEVLTHKGRFRKVTRLWRHGLKEFVPVTLMGEEIHTTLSHKWYTSDSDNPPEFKPIESNPESFKVYLPLLPKGTVSVDKGIAFLTGLYLSDGNLVHRVSNDTFDGLTVSGHSDYVDLYLKTFKDLGLPEPTVSHNKDKSAVTYYFSNSHNLHTAILQYIVPTDTKTGQEKDLLDCVLDWDDESAHYLILGYFFGDGAIKQSAWSGSRDYQYNVSLLGTCPTLMNKLHLLCSRFYTTKLLVEERAPIRKDMFVIRFDTYSTVKFLNFAGDLAIAKSVKVHPSFLTQDMSCFPRKSYGTHTDYGIAKEVRKSRAFRYDLVYTDESYDLEVEEDHSYTVGYNKFIVSNSWRERDDEDLYAGVRKAKATSFADGMSFFSFNSSFRSNYVGDLEYAAKYFNNLTALNFRLDSIAGSILHDPENNIARLVRFLGATTFASPVEGVSQRLRNWLNKNLTEEDILIVVNEVFKNRYTRYKMGVIWTGYETKDDFKEFHDLLCRMVDIRDSSGGNTQITCNCTSLVHSWGTPLYYVPRKSTYLQWLNHFSKIDNKPFYYYPWMPVVDLGIKVNASSHPVDTIVQQALVDMPGEFLRECWLKPSLEGKMASRSAEQVRLLREGMERYGIDPKKQYLEYNPLKNPHQHMTPPYLVGAAKTVSGGDLTKYAEACSKTERGLGSCLVTPATLEKNNLTKCLACGSCPGVDKTRKQFGLKSDLSHLKWMQTRKINVKYTFEDVKTTILVNKPSFYYTFVFKVPKSSKLIANELLVRRFFVYANTIEESLVDNFRNINYSFFNTVDYSGLTPNYHGYEVIQVGFRDRLDEDKFTAIWKQANDLVGGAIQLVKWFPSQESGSNNYLALYELDFNLSMEDFPRVVECLENEQWAWYEDVPVNPETFDLPFRYKVVKGKEGTKLFVLVRPRVNVGYSIGLRLWTYPTIHHRLSDQKIRAVFQESNGQLIDVVTGKVFDVSGFKLVDKGDSSIAAKVYEPEIGGA